MPVWYSTNISWLLKVDLSIRYSSSQKCLKAQFPDSWTNQLTSLYTFSIIQVTIFGFIIWDWHLNQVVALVRLKLLLFVFGGQQCLFKLTPYSNLSTPLKAMEWKQRQWFWVTCLKKCFESMDMQKKHHFVAYIQRALEFSRFFCQLLK